jgi:uncharacterized protein (DUF305 family)
MNNKTALIVLGTLIIGIALGYVLAPKMPGHMGMMGMRDRGMQQNIDAHFIEQMIPHHEGAIEMAEVALERSTRPEVKKLAEDIITAQTSEITQMQQWYRDWYGKAPAESMGHGGMHMQGMEGDLDALRTAPDFDREFTRQMIVHHESAVMMAQMLESGTTRPEMKKLAADIISSQSREIEMMRGWLKNWGSQ